MASVPHLGFFSPQGWQPCVDVGLRGGQAFMGLLFPPCCARCDIPIDSAALYPQFCDACVTVLLARHTACARCGRWFRRPVSTPCPCARDNFPYEGVISLGPYDGSLRDAVRTTKRSAGSSMAFALGSVLADRFVHDERMESADLVTCVSKHWSKRLVTPADGPAALLAGFCHRTKLRGAANLVICRRRIHKQAWLSHAQRRRNVRGAWRVRSSPAVDGKRVVLVDDTMTTGATAEAVSRVLKAAGAVRVVVAVVAKASKM